MAETVRICLQCWRPRFCPQVEKIPWRTWQPTPVFLPEEFHGQRSLVGYSPWGFKELDTTECLTLSLHFTLYIYQFSSVQSLQSCPTLCNPMDCSMPGLPVPHQLLELTQTHVHWVGDAIQPSHPLPSTSPPALRLSQHQVLSSESVLRIRWPGYWSFSFSISPSHEYSRLISFRMDWFDLLAVQGTLKSLLQHHSSKASISTIIFPQCSFLHTAIMTHMCAKSLQLCPAELWHKVSPFSWI